VEVFMLTELLKGSGYVTINKSSYFKTYSSVLPRITRFK